MLESNEDDDIEGLMALLKHKDPEYVRQGIMLAQSFMGEDEIISIAFNKRGWSENGGNWALLEEFPQNQRWQTIKKLELSDINLSILPETIGLLTNLKTLSIEACGLTEVPESIGNLTNLRELNLKENELTSMPDSIGNLTNLEELRLNGNQLVTLPDSIANIPKLKVLNLRDNDSFKFTKKITILKQNGTKIYRTAPPRKQRSSKWMNLGPLDGLQRPD